MEEEGWCGRLKGYLEPDFQTEAKPHSIGAPDLTEQLYA